MMRLIIGSVGSSPLTRGTHLPGLKQKDKDRFIPAYAGNSTNSGQAQFPITVHPRLRGELGCMNKKSFPGVGSSPLTRGTLMKLVLLLRSKRFIPAYAGNSLFTCRKITTFTVHPRLRGELDISFRFSSMKFGSSPLTRGTLKELV